MAKKELDNLSLDMIRCKKDGFGCHYGHWKAIHGNTKDAQEEESAQEGWRICQQCGRPFKPKSRRQQKYCDSVCQQDAQYERDREKYRTRNREYQRRKREGERKLRNESCT